MRSPLELKVWRSPINIIDVATYLPQWGAIAAIIIKKPTKISERVEVA